MAYFEDDKLNRKVYTEIKSGYERIKRNGVENILLDAEQGHSSLNKIIEDVADIIIACEDGKRLFRTYIFDDRIPEDFMNNDDDDEDEDE